MIRDRLPELKAEAISFHTSTESLVLIEHDEINDCIEHCHHSPVMEALLNMYSEILSEFQQILNNIESMKVMTQAKNSKQFNERDFDSLRQNTIKTGNNIMSKFQTIEADLPSESDYTTLARMKRWLYYGFFQHYVVIWSQNEEFFQEYEQKLKNNLWKQSQILNYDLTDEEIDTLIAYNQTSLYTCSILETSHARKTLEALQDRLGELKKLEKSIEEMHELFIRLQNIVIKQSITLQIIEKHFNDAIIYVEEGTKDIREAEIIHKKTRKSKLIYILLVIFAVLLFLIVALFTL